jgi:hypothetical protein
MPKRKGAKRPGRKKTAVTKPSVTQESKHVKKPKRKVDTSSFLWKGPYEHGITQSLMNRFMTCRERFRLYALLGVTPDMGFNHKLEYGNMWHECEEKFAAREDWNKALNAYTQKLVTEHHLERDEILKWHSLCKRQFPIYIDYWKEHDDVKHREPYYQEEEFRVPYKLPSGRSIVLRGKWDAVDIINGYYWIQENKAKGDFNEDKILQDLQFSIQPLMYLIALREHFRQKGMKSLLKNIEGVRYNVIRRPLSGWSSRYNLKQKKGREVNKKVKDPKTGKQVDVVDARGRKVKIRVGEETTEEYYDRVAELIKSEPEYFFFRQRVCVSPTDLKRFKVQFFHRQLEVMCDWWDWITSQEGLDNPFGNNVHYRCPYGLYNPMMLDRPEPYGALLDQGLMSGLKRTTTMFPELSED